LQPLRIRDKIPARKLVKVAVLSQIEMVEKEGVAVSLSATAGKAECEHVYIRYLGWT